MYYVAFDGTQTYWIEYDREKHRDRETERERVSSELKVGQEFISSICFVVHITFRTLADSALLHKFLLSGWDGQIATGDRKIY